jgi:hypothetical protein
MKKSPAPAISGKTDFERFQNLARAAFTTPHSSAPKPRAAGRKKRKANP